MLDQSTLSNRLLSKLSGQDFSSLAAFLEPVTFGPGEIVAKADQPLAHVYFLESGMVSIVARSPEGLRTEAGIIGREGFVHPAIALEAGQIPNDIQIQLKDDAHRVAVSDFSELIHASATLRKILLRYAQVYNVQVTATALTNSVHQVEERLARWLLMVHDRSDSDDLALTHEFLSVMLSVRRPTVTNALHNLASSGFIEIDRGNIMIKKRAAMERYAADAYGVPEAEYQRLLGSS